MSITTVLWVVTCEPLCTKFYSLGANTNQELIYFKHYNEIIIYELHKNVND